MQRKLESLFRATLVGLAILLIWSVWASAQTVSNTTPPQSLQTATTNATGKPPTAELTPEQMQWLTFGLDHVDFLQHSVLSVPLWQYIASLIYIFLAFYLSRLADWLIRNRLKKLAAKTETKLDDLLLDLLRGPIRIVSFVILLHVGLRVFNWPAWLEEFLSKGLKIIVAGSITYVALKLVDLVLGLWREKSAKEGDKVLDDQLFPIIRKSVKVFVVVVAILVTAQNLQFNITGLLASLSIGGLALGLAAQDTVANLFGAFSIFVDKPFRIGERIRVGTDVDGTVESIGLRSTRVRNLDGHLISVPNKTMGNATITNITVRPNIKTEMNLGLTYDTPIERIERATALLHQIFNREPRTEKVLITFNRFTDSSLNLQVVHWWKGVDWEEYLRGLHRLNLEIKKSFDAEGLNFAFPSQTVYLKPENPPGRSATA